MTAGAALVAGALLSACVVTPTPELTTLAPIAPPEIEFAGLVTDVRIYDDHYEFTDAVGNVHAIDIGHHRQVGEHGCCGELLILGTDAEGPFMANFMRQAGLPDDCYVENDVGVDRSSHIEINGILWRKAPGFEDTIAFGTPYRPATRFCFDAAGRVASMVAP